jgi:hypothetical protein
LHLLPPELRRQFQSKIFASNRSALFFRHRTFIESTTLLADSVHLRFSPDTNCPGPFRLRIEITTSRTFVQEVERFTLGPTYEYAIRFRRPLLRYDIQVILDEYLVYASTFDDISIPF